MTVEREKGLSGKVALVTGGSGDIGSSTCVRLAEAGATVVVNYRSSEQAAQELRDNLPGEGHALFQAAVDVTEQVEAMAEFVQNRYGRLDVLVNNAGFTRFVNHADLDGLDDELIDRIFQVNWRGAFACVRAFHSLLDQDGGVIVNISSLASPTGQGSNVAYCASKAALDSMTRSLARALAPNVRVVSVSPGLVDGPYASSFDSDWIQAQKDRTPLGRLVVSEDVASAVLAVVTQMPMTTGTFILVDGGRLLA